MVDDPPSRMLLLSKDASVDTLSSHEELSPGGETSPSRRNMIIEEESYS
jgi:hypothetical protein